MVHLPAASFQSLKGSRVYQTRSRLVPKMLKSIKLPTKNLGFSKLGLGDGRKAAKHGDVIWEGKNKVNISTKSIFLIFCYFKVFFSSSNIHFFLVAIADMFSKRCF